MSIKLLLTSGGITNDSLRNALVEMLGKPIEESSAIIIPTAVLNWDNGPFAVADLVRGVGQSAMTNLGWGKLGLMELTTLPSLERDVWVKNLQEVDAILVAGGDALFLAHWMRESGFADVLPMLDATYVGLSAGSMALTPRIGSDFVTWNPDGRSDETLGLVDFSIFPHLEHPGWEENNMAAADKWSEEIGSLCYAIDDQSAIRVEDGEVSVISEGLWKKYEF